LFLYAIAPFWERQRDVAGSDRCRIVRRLPDGLCNLPAGFLSADCADAVLIFRGAARLCRDFRNSGRLGTFGGQVFV
jgi:hypothetical protein